MALSAANNASVSVYWIAFLSRVHVHTFEETELCVIELGVETGMRSLSIMKEKIQERQSM